MHAGFNAAINGLIQNMTQHGLPQAGVDEVRAAVDKWYADEIKFSEVEPKIAAVYVKDFSEAELKAIVDFYQTPAGQKAIKLMPMVMQDSAQVAQDYTSPKIPSLNATLTPILMKYQKMANAAAGGAPGAGGPGAGMPPAGGGPGGSGN